MWKIELGLAHWTWPDCITCSVGRWKASNGIDRTVPGVELVGKVPAALCPRWTCRDFAHLPIGGTLPIGARRAMRRTLSHTAPKSSGHSLGRLTETRALGIYRASTWSRQRGSLFRHSH